MNSVNLLPPAMEQYKKTRRLKISLIILQAAIFLCVGVAVLFLRQAEQNLRSRSSRLAESIATFDDEPLWIVTELEQAHAITRYYDNFILENFPVTFDSHWVAVILENLPDNAKLIQLRYNPPEIVLHGEVGYMQDAHIYRQLLADTGLFSDVSLGRVSLLESGMFSYEMTMQVGQDE